MKKLISLLLIISINISIVEANAIEALVGGIIGGVLGSSQTHKKTYHKRTYHKRKHHKKRRKKVQKKSHISIPKGCSTEQWTTQVINNKQFATNFQGVMVTHNDNGFIVKAKIKNKIPSMFRAGDQIQLTTKFNKGSKTTSALISNDLKYLIISDIESLYIVDKLKKSSYIEIEFVNNKYCTQLKGSGNSIKTVESAISFTQNKASNSQTNFPTNNKVIHAAKFSPPALASDSINTARVERAIQNHIGQAQRIASNQKEFTEKLIGIRPKSDLDAADGNINDVKIQYYIPGKEDIGEMWVSWFIDEEKGPIMTLNFIDPTHKYENKAYIMKISLMPIEEECNIDVNVKSNKNTSPSCKIIKDILIADKWARIAKKASVKRRYRKRVSFIRGNEKNKNSLGVYFQVYENGAMTVQLEDKKFGMPKRFNFTFTQALELSRYIADSRKKAHTTWMNETRTEGDLDAMFN